MKICILGLGVIGTTYGYLFQKAGHTVVHLLREEKQASAPTNLDIKILDGRTSKTGTAYNDVYPVELARAGDTFDLIIVSVPSGKLAAAINTIKENRIAGPVLIFCGAWQSDEETQKALGDRQFVFGYPVAGGRMQKGTLECVVFDHIMLESRDRAGNVDYEKVLELLSPASLGVESPFDMVEWIWVHMAINAGITSTAASAATSLKDPHLLAMNLMSSAKLLAKAVKCVRETLRVVAARGVNLHRYKNEILAFRFPAIMAGILMKWMFKRNLLSRKIMTLHTNLADILYVCHSVEKTAKARGVNLPIFFENMDRVRILESNAVASAIPKAVSRSVKTKIN